MAMTKQALQKQVKKVAKAVPKALPEHIKKVQKYRWFMTKRGKVVYGGKSAQQNEETVKHLLENEVNRIVMHTKHPGSPFAIIEERIGHVTLEDMNETAGWTACFSRAWRSSQSRCPVDIFLSEQLVKKPGMKAGTFGVLGEIDTITVDLQLVLCKQEGVLRAVPPKSAQGKVLAKIIPGAIPKDAFAEELAKKLKVDKEEVLSALPTGGFSLA